MILRGRLVADDDLDVGGHHIKDWRYLADIPQGGASLGQVMLWDGSSWAPGAAGSSGTTVLWEDILGVPSTFAPTAHSHVWADITDPPTIPVILNGTGPPPSATGLAEGTWYVRYTP